MENIREINVGGLNKKKLNGVNPQYDEIIRIVKIKINSRSKLIEWVNKKLKLKILKATSYYNILEKIVNSDNETKFSKRMFDLSSFDEIIEKNLIFECLSIFSKETTVTIAEKLSQNKKKWKFTKTNLGDLTTTLVSHTHLKDYERLFPELIQKETIPKLIQYRRVVVGPLGITRSIADRSGSDAYDLAELLSTYLTDETVIYFRNNARFLYSDILNDKNYSVDEIQQLILTYATDEDIKNLFTVLIENQFIKINGEEYSSIGIITPQGIITNNSDDPIKDLVSLVLEKTNRNALDIHLKEEGHSSGPLENRLYAKCLMTPLEDILNHEFGMNDLREIGKQLGLIRLDYVTQKDQLIRYLLLALGFTISTEISGISTYLKLLEDYKNKFESETDSEQLRGLMMNVYIQSEKILKDLIYFHISVIWSNEQESEDSVGKLSIARKIMRKKLGEKRDFSKPSFGQLVYLMKKMNSYVSDNEDKHKLIKNELGRDYVFPLETLEGLVKIAESRSQYSHDSENQKADSLSSMDIIKKLLSISRILKSEKIYPITFRVTQDITNQYGVTYLESIDEDGIHWTIKTKEMLDPGTLGMMYSKTDKIAVFPFLVTKYW